MIKYLSRAGLALLVALSPIAAIAQTFPGQFPPLYAYGNITSAPAPPTAIPFSSLGGQVSAIAYGADPTGAADSATAINNALSANPGKCVYLPGGTYKVLSEIIMHANGACLVGDGPQATTINATNATQNGVHILSSGVANARLENIGIFNISATPTGGAGVAVDINSSGVIINNVLSRNNFVGFSLGASAGGICNLCSAVLNYSDGFLFANSIAQNVMQWQLLFSQSSENNGWGYNMNSSVALNIVPPYFNTSTSFANAAGGYRFGGSAGLYGDNLMTMVTSSGDGVGGGIAVQLPGPRFHLSGIYVESVGQFANGRLLAVPAALAGCGVSISGPGSSDTTIEINDVKVWGNSDQGICVSATPVIARLALNGVYAINNGLAGVNRAGIDLENTTTHYLITGSYAVNVSGAGQTYGLKAANGANVYIANNDFTGNVTGGCLFTSNLPNGTSAGTGCQGNLTFFNVTATNISSGTATIANSGATPFAGAPAELWANSSGGADAKSWYGYVDTSGVWHLCATNDAFSVCNDAFAVTRSGNTPTKISFPEQIVSTAGLPTIAGGACGAGANGAVVAGSTNQSGNITIGAAPTTTCALSWSATLATAPSACVFFPANATAAVTATTAARTGAPSTSGVTLTGTALASANYSYFCM